MHFSDPCKCLQSLLMQPFIPIAEVGQSHCLSIHTSLTMGALVNPLTGDHVLVSPHRMKRPWQGQIEPPQPSELPEYDPACYLCPGNERAGGQKNENYRETMTFENDFTAVLPPPIPDTPKPPHPLLVSEPVHGACDVLIFHPRHDLTLSKLPVNAIENIINQWRKIYVSRGNQEGVEYVQIFEVDTSIR